MARVCAVMVDILNIGSCHGSVKIIINIIKPLDSHANHRVSVD